MDLDIHHAEDHVLSKLSISGKKVSLEIKKNKNTAAGMWAYLLPWVCPLWNLVLLPYFLPSAVDVALVAENLFIQVLAFRAIYSYTQYTYNISKSY